MLKRIALTGVAVSTAVALLPSLATASIAPTLALNQSAGTAGGSSSATGFDVNFNPQGGDSAKELTVGFPAGLVVNLNAAGGACLSASGPTPECAIGSGTINGPTGPPATLYLVAAPRSSDVAGVALVIEGRATVVGGLALTGSSGVALSLSFAGLAPGINELQFTLSSPRLPTSCSAAQVTVQAVSQQGSSASTSAPFTVTGCGSLPYAPTIAATVTKQFGSSAALVVTSVNQVPGEAATSGISFKVPSDLRVNKVLGGCLEGAPCKVGSVSVSSPLLPSSAFGGGTLTLGGTLSSSTLTMGFPAPYAFSVKGAVSLMERTIKFTGLPDLPLTDITFTFSGTSAGRAFTTSCSEAAIAVTLTPVNGNAAHTTRGAIKNIGCPAHAKSSPPTASGALTGLASGKPQFRLSARAGSGGPGIRSLSIRLPLGLRFAGHLLAARAKGLSLSGAIVRSASVQGGSLRVVFRRPSAHVSLKISGPLLAESGALQRRAKRHTARGLVVHVRLTDARGGNTTVGVL